MTQNRVIQNLDKFDIRILALFVFGLPLVMLAIYALPSSLKLSMFILEVHDPHLTQIFLSNFVHTKLQHLASNAAMFIMCMAVIQMFESRKRVFLLSYLIFLLVLPFFVSYASTANLVANYPNIVYSLGASGVVAAFMGYAMLSIIIYVYDKSNKTLKDNIFIIFLIGMSVVVALSIGQVQDVSGGVTNGMIHLIGFVAGMVIPRIIYMIDATISYRTHHENETMYHSRAYGR